MLKFQVYPQKPLVKTKSIDLIGFDKLGAGQNSTIAVMSYSGYDIEDAIVINKASLDRGFGRCVVLRKHSTQIKQYSNRMRDRIVPPGFGLPDSMSLPARFNVLDDDGIVSPGSQRTQKNSVFF